MKPMHEMIKASGLNKQDFLKRCMQDFKFFGEQVLGLHIEPFHVEWAKMFYSNKRACVIAFRGCIAEGTKIMMGDKSLKNIEDVKNGDSIYSFNQTTRKFEVKKVLNSWYAGDKECIRSTTRTCKSIITTVNHKFYSAKYEVDKYVDYKMRPITEIHGDELSVMVAEYTQYSTWTKSVVSYTIPPTGEIELGKPHVERLWHKHDCGIQPTYDLEVEDNHNFIANGFIVSNSGKTQIAGTAFPLWLMCFDTVARRQRKDGEALKFMIVSPTLKMSKKIIRDIKSYISNNEFLNNILKPENPFRGEGMWTKEEILTKNGCYLFTRTYSDNIRGEHVNYVLVEEASYMEDTTVYEKAIIPMVGNKQGHIMMIGCLTPDTSINLPNGKTKQIIDMKIGDKVLSLNSKTLKQEEGTVTHLIDNGIQEVYKLQTQYGREIKSTSNHPYFTREGWKELSEVKVGDYIAIPNRNLTEYIKPINKLTRLAKVYGYLTGDGSISFNKGSVQILFSNSNKDIIKGFMSTLKSCGFDSTCSSKMYKGAYAITVKNARELARQLGYKTNQYSGTKYIADFIMQGSQNAKIAFLEGYLDSDGCVNNGWYTWYTTSNKIKNNLMTLLLTLNVLPSNRTRYNQGITGKTIIHEIQVRNLENVKYLNRLLQKASKQINIKEDSTSGEIIPLTCDETKIAHSIINNRSNKNQYKSQLQKYKLFENLTESHIRWSKITSIEHLGKYPTVNLTIDTGNFVANQIYTHNTPKSEIDLLARCRMPNSVYQVSEYPAIKDGRSMWEWRFSIDTLEDIKKDQGELTFAREYMCQMTSDESQAIQTKDIIACYDDTLRLDTNLSMDGSPKLLLDGETEVLPNKMGAGLYTKAKAAGRITKQVPTRYTGIDLAMSARGDYSVSITLEAVGDNRWLLRHMDRRQGMGFKPHQEWVNRIYQTFKPVNMAIDKSQFGEGLISELRMEYGIPCDPFTFTYDSRREGFARAIRLWENHQLIIPRYESCPYTMRMTDELIRESSALIPTRTPSGLETYKTITRHDDSLIALCICASIIPVGQGGEFYMTDWGGDEHVRSRDGQLR